MNAEPLTARDIGTIAARLHDAQQRVLDAVTHLHAIEAECGYVVEPAMSAARALERIAERIERHQGTVERGRIPKR